MPKSPHPSTSTSVYTSSPHPGVVVITLSRPHKRNAVDRPTATLLHRAFVDFERDEEMKVAILTGAEGTFCAGADLSAIQRGEGNLLESDMEKMGPMGPTRLSLRKPVLAAVEGYAVAGGLELACWADLRIASSSSQWGVSCRLRGVPLIDGGSVRLPALIGVSRAMDLVLSGRTITATEAHEMGLVNYLTPPGEALGRAIEVARSLLSHPQTCMLNDRYSLLASSLSDVTAEEQDPSTSPTTTGERAVNNVQGKMRRDMEREFILGLESLARLADEGKIEDFLQRRGANAAKL